VHVSKSLVVLGWHNVEGTWYFPSGPGGGLAALERQLTAIRRLANVVPLGEALKSLAEGRPVPQRAVAITFDDGYSDTLSLAVPLLERLGLPATFFLVPGLLSGDVRPWWEVLAWAFTCTERPSVDWEESTLRLNGPADRRASTKSVAESLKGRVRVERERRLDELVDLLAPPGSVGSLFLDWKGARELVDRGFAIGSHSMHHAILCNETEDAQHTDLDQSRRRLEEELSVRVELLAYPGGGTRHFDAKTVSAARSAGYTHALTLIPGVNRPGTDVYEIRRFLMYPHAGRFFLARVFRFAARRALQRLRPPEA
jgi:peptidoglycan/xylan/chitin deacetylase (PgdA/CDA1 family)